MSDQTDAIPADAVPNGWVDRFLPQRLRPWARLMRLDRPVGVWLLLWPCWWGLMLSVPHRWVPSYLLTPEGQGHLQTIAQYLIFFGIGALVMRAAGCIVNDLWDRRIDARVARTAARPIASGAISPAGALIMLVLLGVIGLAVLIQFATSTVMLGILALPLVVLYPLAKRVTHWPQLVLGIVFNWGALMGWTALHGAWDTTQMEFLGWTTWAAFQQLWPVWPAFALYAGCILWTLGYDTIYAHQDREDDVKAGVKSSALALGDRTIPFLYAVYGGAICFWALAGWGAYLSVYFYIGLLFAGLHFRWQIRSLDINDPAKCLAIFKSNIWFGWIMLFAILAGWVH